MSRYLTAEKITTLVLIDLYLSATSAPLSPHLQLLDFISAQILPASSDVSLRTTSGGGFESDVNNISSATSKIKAALNHCDGRIPGRSVYHEVLGRLWEINDVDSLESLFVVLKGAIAPVGFKPYETEQQQRYIASASPLGVFIRRCCVEFSRLQFTDTLSLFEALKRLRQSSYADWAQRHPVEAKELATDAPIKSPEAQAHENNGQAPLPLFVTSAHDVEAVLSLSISRLQKFGVRLPPAMTLNLRRWVSSQQDPGAQSSQYFLAFFESWKSGQHSMAVENLHRYFDYSLAKGAASGGDEDRLGIKQYYQYALLHLSVLHADFEYWEASIEAMKECIATARENQDNACLAFALSWQMYIRQTYSRGGKATSPSTDDETTEAILPLSGHTQLDEIAFLKTIARDGKHWTLLASALLEEAKFHMCTSGSSTKAFEGILQSSHLTVQHGLQTLIPAALLFHGACIQRLGQQHLAFQLYDTALTVNADFCPMTDRVRAACRIAMELVQMGRYTEAVTVLDVARNQGFATEDHGWGIGSLKLRQRLLAFGIVVQAKELLNRNCIADVSSLITELNPFLASSDPEMTFEISNLIIEHLIAIEDFNAALTKVNALLAQTKQEIQQDISKTLHLLILKAKVFANIPGPNAAKGLSLVLRASSVAERCRLLPLLHEALAVLCLILLELGEYCAVRDLASSLLPGVIESSNLDLQSRLFISLGEAHVAIAGYECAPGSVERKQNTRLATKYFNRSLQVRHVLDVLAMKARLLQFEGDEKSAALLDEKFFHVMENNDTKGAVSEPSGV